MVRLADVAGIPPVWFRIYSRRRPGHPEHNFLCPLPLPPPPPHTPPPPTDVRHRDVYGIGVARRGDGWEARDAWASLLDPP